VDILAQAALGLHDAHEARTASGVLLGLVHRDVSPQNLLIGAEGRTRLTDFGIAHATQSRLTETEHGRIKGKFAYFSPEQSMGAELDRRSDIFALGIVGWEMLAGCRLFAREQPSDTIAAVRSGPIPQLDQVRPDLSPALVRVIDRALRRPAQRRYETARDMAEALRAVYGTGALGQTEAYVKELRPERIVQLEARIREAVGSPEIRTLPDIDVEAPAFEEPDITQLPSLGVTTNRKLRSEMPTMILGDATDALDRSPDSAEGRTRRTGLVIAAALALAIVGVVAFVSLSARPGEDSTPSSATELPLDPPLSPVVPAGAAAPQPEEAGENASGAETDATTASDRLPLASTSSMRARRGARAAPGMGSDDDSSPEATPMDRVPAGRAAGLELFDNASSMR
jgi:serine/threonine-protein kinase